MSRTDTGAKGAARSWFAQLREDGIKDGMWDAAKSVNSNTIRGIVGTLSRVRNLMIILSSRENVIFLNTLIYSIWSPSLPKLLK
jgi:hypothetical protein